MVCFHISAKNNQNLTCFTPLAANRTPNRMGIRMGNRTCRRPLNDNATNEILANTRTALLETKIVQRIYSEE
jgi:hypothetical protein